MTPKYDPETILDNGGANDNDQTKTRTSAVAAARNSTAIAAIEALGAIVSNIDTAGYGSSSKPMLSFKSREGTWQIGHQRTIPEKDVPWMINVITAEHGYVCFGENNKPISRMAPAHKPMPDQADLPDTGFKWNEQKAFQLKCLEGADQDVEVEFRTTTVGGVQAFNELFEQVKSRFNGGRHENKLFPIVQLDQTSYPHPEYGKINNPVFTVVGWATSEGPEQKPAPASPPPPKSPPSATTASEQPRRRQRVI